MSKNTFDETALSFCTISSSFKRVRGLTTKVDPSILKVTVDLKPVEITLPALIFSPLAAVCHARPWDLISTLPSTETISASTANTQHAVNNNAPKNTSFFIFPPYQKVSISFKEPKKEPRPFSPIKCPNSKLR